MSNCSKEFIVFLFSGIIQFVASNHKTFTNADKTKVGKMDFSKIPSGTNGAFERMSVLWAAGVVSIFKIFL